MIAMGLVNCVTGPRVKGGCCLFWCLRRSVRSRHDARSMPGHHTHVHKLSGRSAAKTKQVTLSHAVAHPGTSQASRINTRTHSQPASASRTSLGQVILRSPHDAMRSHALSTPPDRAAPHASLAGVLLRPWSRATACAPPPAASHQTTGTHTHTHTHTRPLRSKGEPNGRPRRWLLSPAYGQLPGSAPVAASNSSSSLSQSRLASVTMSTRRSTLNLSR